MQSNNRSGHSQKKVRSFLLQSTNNAEVETEKRGPTPNGTFLRGGHEDRKERTSLAPAHDRNVNGVPRTIANETLLSHKPKFENSNLCTPTTYLRDLGDTEYTFARDSGQDSTEDTMAVPPHLRAKKAPSHNKTVKKGTTGELPPASDKSNAVGEPAPDLNSAQDQGTAGAKPHAKRAGADIHDQRPALTVIGEKKQNTLQVPSGQSTSGAYIRQKLQEEHGVKVTAPKPAEPAKVALVPYPSSNEDGHPSANGGAKAANGRSQDGKTKASSARSSKGKQANGADSDRRSNRGGATNHRGRGRGGALQGRLPRESRWPKTADTRPDPHRWDKDIKWNDSSSDVDSAEADSGFGSGKKKKKRDDGIDEETGFILTDWTGGFAPVSQAFVFRSCGARDC